MSTKKKIETNAAPSAIGPYSQAIIQNGFVFCSGQIPLDPTTGVLAPADVAAQTKQVLKNVAGLLEASGSSPARIVKTSVFLTDLTKFDVFNKEYQTFFESVAPGVPFPARSTFQVGALPRGAMVEIEVIATVG